MLDNHDDDLADGDDDPLEGPRCDTSDLQDFGGRFKLACPFVKHDPGKYNPVDYHTCATTAWGSIHRLK